MSALVTFVYWSLFTLVAFLALSFLLGTIWRNAQLSTARMQVDDGSEDPDSDSFRIYRLSLRSSALAALSVIAFLPLLTGAVLAFAGSTALTAAIGIALSVISLVAGDAIRTRHGMYEKEFHRLSGRTIQSIHAEVIERMEYPSPPRCDEQSATLN